MATRKTAAKTPTKTTRAKKDEPAAEDTAQPEATPAPPVETAPQPEAAPPAPGFVEQAAEIAADVRALAVDTQQAISALNTRCVALIRADTGEHAAATSGVQRLPMAAPDLHRALRAYESIAAELAAATQR